MRTTIDLPDHLYRSLKVRASLSGVSLRELVTALIEQALGQGQPGPPEAGATRTPPPVIIPSTGRVVELTVEDVHRLEEEEDLERLARSS